MNPIMDLSKIFSARSITLLLFILAVLFIGTMFNVKVGSESFDSRSLMSGSFGESKEPTKKP